MKIPRTLRDLSRLEKMASFKIHQESLTIHLCQVMDGPEGWSWVVWSNDPYMNLNFDERVVHHSDNMEDALRSYRTEIQVQMDLYFAD